MLLRLLSFVGLLAAASLPVLAADKPASSKASNQVYELRTYHTNDGKLDALNKRFREHTNALFQKHGMTAIGYWTPMDEKDGKGGTLIYLLAFPSREAAQASWDAFRKDPEWQTVKAESEKDGPLVKKVESLFLEPTDYSPALSRSQAKSEASGDGRVFELRTYIASPGKLGDLHKRFREHTVDLFTKHGMTSIAYWSPMDEDKGRSDTLVYLLAFPSRDAAAASWKAFGSDPDWQKVYKESQPDGIPLAAKVKSVYLTPTDYSPMK